VERNIKIKLDKLLAEGHIDTDEYKHMVASISKKKPNKSNNKKIIIISVILLIIYGFFSAYQDFKTHQKIEEQQQFQNEINQAIQNGGLFDNP